MANTHLIADESIGGIQREYIEVERKADVGDYVFVRKMDGDVANKIAKVQDNDYDDDGSCETLQLETFVNGEDLLIYGVPEDDDFSTLEPTDIVVVDGNRYRMVDRKAEVGEKVIVVKGSGWYDNKIGSIYPVISGREYGFDSKYDLDEGEVYVENGENESGFCSFVYRENYRVLEPIADETHIEVDGRHASPEVIDLLANLAHRVTSLEAQLADTQGNVEKLAEEMASVKHLAESNEGDIAMLDERTSEKQVVINTSNITVNKDADIDAIARALSKRLEAEVLANE